MPRRRRELGTTADVPGIGMTHTIEISDELRDRLDLQLEEDETYEELIAELLAMYETEGTFLQEGYSE
ncbi:hypothetical protein ACFR9U_21140 [Halorientalis brevis]|uniref:Uncharacterized protein n=1 Tax=Halorientalis brevis TaxID=1126241 RepID=A0ABD6CGZ8_9EURY|nr:hypothetical protein [Halorientalis brevis]